ncbi:hypothetical protein TWF481_003773 [Arthrobotrys musiformis]|uniref:Uncharacterized protein n=1 Tax=Arthrobotrys musiformis TaxID=47236 RepID=A0AAV9WHK1_9PEZI
MIKRKPVSTSGGIISKPESQVKTSDLSNYRIPRKPLSPVAVVPKPFTWPAAGVGNEAPAKEAATAFPTTVENVDGNDYRTFLERTRNGPIENGTHPCHIPGRENAASGDLRAYMPTFTNAAIGAEVPTDIENTTTAFPPTLQQRNSSTSQSIPRTEIENSETRIIHQRNENSAADEYLEDGDAERDIYEEFAYHFPGQDGVSRAGTTLISLKTLLENLERHSGIISRTGSAAGRITIKSVGPISKMLREWLITQERSGLPYRQPIDTLLKSTTGLDELLSSIIPWNSSNIEVSGLTLTGLLKLRKQYDCWNALWQISVISCFVCGQLFSLDDPEILLSSCDKVISISTHVDKGEEGSSWWAINETRKALHRELSDAVSKNWTNKGYILLNSKAGKMIWKGAQYVLKHVYQSGFSYGTLDECHKFRNQVLLAIWQSFLRNISAGPGREPQLLPPEPFSSITGLFGVLKAFESPHEPPKYFANSHPDIQFLITTNYSTSLESEKYSLIRKEDESIRRAYLESRQEAIRNGEWTRAISIIDKMLSSIYPGVEEAKRWLAVKSYLLAITHAWNESITIQMLLRQDPLDTNDRLYLEIYFTTAITILLHQKDLRAARASGYVAALLPEFVVPEDERVCDRKNVDILYGILFSDVVGGMYIRNQEDHIRRLYRALSAWGQGGHLFEPKGPFHYAMDARLLHEAALLPPPSARFPPPKPHPQALL